MKRKNRGWSIWNQTPETMQAEINRLLRMMPTMLTEDDRQVARRRIRRLESARNYLLEASEASR